MTWATIHYVNETTMAVEFGYAERQKDAIAAMTGAEWDKSSRRWLVPVGRLGEVSKLFFPNLTFDYRVLRARDHALIRMFENYMAMGVRFAVVAGKVACDQPLLNEWFASNSTVLHVNALLSATDNKKMTSEATERPRIDVLSQNDQIHVGAHIVESKSVSASHTASKQATDSQPQNRDIALWLKGVQNAVKNEERKAQLRRKQR